jgi:hypothetical protein
MTANAVVGGKELCIRSGMDVYIANPLAIKDLFVTIENTGGHLDGSF